MSLKTKAVVLWTSLEKDGSEVHLEVRWTQLDDKLHLVDKENIMNELGSD